MGTSPGALWDFLFAMFVLHLPSLQNSAKLNQKPTVSQTTPAGEGLDSFYLP